MDIKEQVIKVYLIDGIEDLPLIKKKILALKK